VQHLVNHNQPASSRGSRGFARYLVLLFGVTSVVLSVSCDGRDVDMRSPAVVRVAVGSTGGDFSNFGHDLQETVKAATRDYTVALARNVGIRTLEAVDAGQMDCGFAYANLAYEAFSGKAPENSAPLANLRGVATIQVTPLNFVVREDSRIQSIRDLKGRRVVAGIEGSGSLRAASVVLESYGLSAASVELQSENFGSGYRRLVQGEVDAVLHLTIPPLGSEARPRVGIRVVPLEGPELSKLRVRYPFLRPVLMPPKTYLHQVEPLRTIGIQSLLLCGQQVSSEQVRQVTADWFATLERVIDSGRLLDGFGPQVASATPIPLHPGAQAFYRARQIVAPGSNE
jgi:TRAP transporter TAXI family solute receptor